MTLGQKIKNKRKELGLTQRELAGEKITRNMLSAIESDKASPSVDTARYLADRLELPFSYLMADDDNLFLYKKNSSIDKIRLLYKDEERLSCIKEIEALCGIDDELSLILAECYYHLGKQSVLNGALITGAKQINTALEHAKSCIYNTSYLEAGAHLYLAIASNIQAPTHELNNEEFLEAFSAISELELYKYIVQDSGYEFNNVVYSNHIKAKELIKNKKFYDAIKLLVEIEAARTKDNYNSYVVFSIYTDLERCYREIGSYENAYRYASKRLSLLEAFKQ